MSELTSSVNQTATTEPSRTGRSFKDWIVIILLGLFVVSTLGSFLLRVSGRRDEMRQLKESAWAAKRIVIHYENKSITIEDAQELDAFAKIIENSRVFWPSHEADHTSDFVVLLFDGVGQLLFRIDAVAKERHKKDLVHRYQNDGRSYLLIPGGWAFLENKIGNSSGNTPF